MKKLLTILFMLAAYTSFSQKSEFDISTLRMGPYKIFMPLREAEGIAGKKFTVPSEQNHYNAKNNVTYNGYTIEMEVYEFTENDYQIASLTTSNPKFKTKSGIGVGSTRHQVIEAYKDFSSFTLYPEWNEDSGGYSKTNYDFMVNDLKAGTYIIFKLVNNRVAEITVSVSMDGC